MAKPAQVNICNMALVGIGHTELIEDLDEGSTESDICELEYDQCRDEVLESWDWDFARKRQQPAALDDTTLDLGAVPSGWTYAFALPADCVPNGLRAIYSGTRNPREDEKTPFAVEYDGATAQSIVLTDIEEPEFIYTARVEDPNRFSALFVRALAERLAIPLLRGLRKDPRLVDQQWKLYQATLAMAIAATKKNVQPDVEPAPSWIANRG